VISQSQSRSQASAGIDGWLVFSTLGCLLILAPLAIVFWGALTPGDEWPHIQSTVLPRYVANTLVLLLGVGLLSFILATPTAWLITEFRFPGRAFWSWALVLPLAIPSYIAAFTYFGFLDELIPLIVLVRSHFGLEASLQLEAVMRYSLLILLMSSVLQPYLFLSLRTAFARQPAIYAESARLLGSHRFTAFRKVTLPLARPALIAGLSLISMEVINDYGAVNFFGVPTLTEGIFRTWFGLEDRHSALRLALLMVTIVAVVLVVEHWLRRRSRFADSGNSARAKVRSALDLRGALLANSVCAIPFLLGFGYPVYRLLSWWALTWDRFDYGSFYRQAATSSALALLTAVVVAGMALVFAYAARISPRQWQRRLIGVSSLGYAIPGAVVAVGVMVLVGRMDQLSAPHVLLGGTWMALSFAYAIRFLTVAFQPLQAAMSGTGSELHEASGCLGKSNTETFLRIHLPLLRYTLAAAMLLVFIDILKELPLTLIMRPSNFESLATFAYGLAKEGQIQDCALPSLIVVLLGGLAVTLTNRWLDTDQ